VLLLLFLSHVAERANGIQHRSAARAQQQTF
jgi:hypothetical protein